MSPRDHRGKPAAPVERETTERWECHCQTPGVLLGKYKQNGQINIKARDRYWHVEGVVRTVCPRCGAEHVLDLRHLLPDPPLVLMGRTKAP